MPKFRVKHGSLKLAADKVFAAGQVVELSPEEAAQLGGAVEAAEESPSKAAHVAPLPVTPAPEKKGSGKKGLFS